MIRRIFGLIVALVFSLTGLASATPPVGPYSPPSGQMLVGARVDPENFCNTPPNSGNSPSCMETSMETLESAIGHPFATELSYYSWTGLGNNFPEAPETASAYQFGRIPVISWGCGDTDDNVAAGMDDATIKAAAQKLEVYPSPIFLRWMWEMNLQYTADSRSACYGSNDGTSSPEDHGTGSPIKANFFSAQNFVAAWDHIRTVMANQYATDGYANNIIWLWNPGSPPTNSSSLEGLYYPGDSETDWVGFDLYNTAGNAPPVAGYMNNAYSYITGITTTKPIMVGETGAVDGTGQTNTFPNIGTTGFFTAYPNIEGWNYFDVNANSDWSLIPGHTGYNDFLTMMNTTPMEAPGVGIATTAPTTAPAVYPTTYATTVPTTVPTTAPTTIPTTGPTHVPWTAPPTVAPTQTPLYVNPTPYSYRNGSTPLPFTLPSTPASITVIAQYQGSASSLGADIAYMAGWSLEAGKTDGSNTQGTSVDAHSYDANANLQAVPTLNLTQNQEYALVLTIDGTNVTWESCAQPAYTCQVITQADANALAPGVAGTIGQAVGGYRIVHGDIWDFLVYSPALNQTTTQLVVDQYASSNPYAGASTPPPPPTPTPTPTSMTTPTPTPTPTATPTPGGSNAQLLCVHFATNPMCQQLPSSPAISPNSSAWAAAEFSGGRSGIQSMQISNASNPFNDGYDASEPRYELNVGQSTAQQTISCSNVSYSYTLCSIEHPNMNGIVLNMPKNVYPAGTTDHHLAYDDFNNNYEVDLWLSNLPSNSGGTLKVGSAGICYWGTDGTGCSDATATNIDTSLGGINADILQAAEGVTNGTLPYALSVSEVCNDISADYVYPATKSDGDNSDGFCNGRTGAGQGPPEGTRGFLAVHDSTIDGWSIPNYDKVVLRTMDEDHFGFTITDTNWTGSSWALFPQFNRGNYQFAATEAGVPYGTDATIPFTIPSGVNLQSLVTYCSNGTC